MQRHRYRTHDVLAMLEADEDMLQQSIRTDIFISPPADPSCSDEDSGDEDTGGNYNNLSSKQLESEAVATVRTLNGGDVWIGEDDTDELEAELPPPTKRQRQSTGRPKPVERNWLKEDLPKEKRHEAGIFSDQYAAFDMGPASLFEFFFDEDVIGMIEKYTKAYAMQKGKHDFEISANEIRLFLAILYTSGYAPLPRRRQYWEPADDVQNVAISKAMTRNRFEEIMQFLHLADNQNLAGSDRVAKVRPLLSLMNERFVKYFPQQASLSIDESMVPYYGRHGMKQFIRGKPIRFGYKVWSVNTPLGYCIQFEPYQGAGVTDSSLGLGGSVILDLMARLPEAKYQLFFDNFFTSIRLLNKLSDMSIGATGTVRVNRVEKCPLTPPEQLKKMPRGTFDYRHDQTTGALVVRWNDNSVVTVASNCFGIEPCSQAQRWSYAEKKKITISQPHMIAQYNKHMGGVDRMDQNVGVYRISIRSKKWWWPFFAYCADVAMQNAWLLYRLTEAHKAMPMDQLQFRRAICGVYYARYSADRATVGRPLGRPQSMVKRVPADIRYDGLDHMIAQGPTQRRCGYCSKKVTHICAKCDVGLHVWCFSAFHSKQ